jgi:hypothetical protein
MITRRQGGIEIYGAQLLSIWDATSSFPLYRCFPTGGTRASGGKPKFRKGTLRDITNITFIFITS